MYKCEICQRIVPAKTSAHRVVLETRRKVYPFRENANRVISVGKKQYTDDSGGVGFETVREAIACAECAARHRDDNARVPVSKAQAIKTRPP